MMIEDNLWQLMMKDDDRWWLYSLIKRLLVMEQMDRWIDGQTDNTENGLRLWERGWSLELRLWQTWSLEIFSIQNQAFNNFITSYKFHTNFEMTLKWFNKYVLSIHSYIFNFLLHGSVNFRKLSKIKTKDDDISVPRKQPIRMSQ